MGYLDEKHLKRTAKGAEKKAEEHHAIVADCQKARGVLKASKGLEGPLAELLDSFIAHHSALGDEEMNFADHCLQLADYAKAAQLSNRERGDALVPDGVHKVVPTVPRQGFTAIPRFGAPQIQEQPHVDAGLAKVAGLNNEDLHSEETSLQRQ
jgi:hypothetical protein